MKYAHIESNKIVGWYDSAIHKDIPVPNVEVTSDIWQKALSINANYYDGKTFSYKESEIVVSEVNTISRLQAKLYLLDSGYYDQVMALVEENVRLKIYWSDAVNFNKDDEILRGVQAAIGLTDEQLDTMFLEAGKL